MFGSKASTNHSSKFIVVTGLHNEFVNESGPVLWVLNLSYLHIHILYIHVCYTGLAYGWER